MQDIIEEKTDDCPDENECVQQYRLAEARWPEQPAAGVKVIFAFFSSSGVYDLAEKIDNDYCRITGQQFFY